MWALSLLLFLGVAAPAALSPGSPARGECAADSGGVTLCVYRSFVPSTGIVSSCRDGRDCRVGYYYGKPADPVWFERPPGMSAMPAPEVFWVTSALAQVRVDCGPACSWSYFFEVTRRRLSAPRRGVLGVDARRSLIAAAESRALVLRQIFSGREVRRIEREWAPAGGVGDVITALRFDPDGRISFTWLRGAARTPVSERLSVPSVPQS